MPNRYVAALAVVCLATGAHAESGIASVYGTENGQTRTATGERYTGQDMTCAHKSAPLGSRLRVTDLRSGRSIICRCNDRGPFVRGRIIDLSLRSARALGVRGLARVRVEIMK